MGVRGGKGEEGQEGAGGQGARGRQRQMRETDPGQRPRLMLTESKRGREATREDRREEETLARFKHARSVPPASLYQHLSDEASGIPGVLEAPPPPCGPLEGGCAGHLGAQGWPGAHTLHHDCPRHLLALARGRQTWLPPQWGRVSHGLSPQGLSPGAA